MLMPLVQLSKHDVTCLCSAVHTRLTQAATLYGVRLEAVEGPSALRMCV